MRRTELTGHSLLLSQNSRRHSLQQILKGKHEHSYDNSGKERTQLMSTSQFRILTGHARLTDRKTFIEYFMEGINTGILQKIFSQNPLPAMIEDWYTSAMKFDSQHR